MSDDGKDILGFIAGLALLICGMSLFLRPSQMRICINAGYEWRGGDCVRGADRD